MDSWLPTVKSHAHPRQAKRCDGCWESNAVAEYINTSIESRAVVGVCTCEATSTWPGARLPPLLSSPLLCLPTLSQHTTPPAHPHPDPPRASPTPSPSGQAFRISHRRPNSGRRRRTPPHSQAAKASDVGLFPHDPGSELCQAARCSLAMRIARSGPSPSRRTSTAGWLERRNSLAGACIITCVAVASCCNRRDAEDGVIALLLVEAVYSSPRSRRRAHDCFIRGCSSQHSIRTSR